MEPDPRPTSAPSPSPFRIWHFVAVFLTALAVALVGLSIGVAIHGEDVEDPGWAGTLGSAVGQFGAYAVALVAISRRRGSGSLRRDCGLELRARDWWCVPAGAGLLIVAGAVLYPLTRLVDDEQAVVEDIRDAPGAEVAVLVVIAVLLAPVFEELVFRGLLLRALLGRVDTGAAIALCAGIFAVLHVLLDLSLGTVVRLPALAAVGAVTATLVVRSGSLSPAILFHLGFNSCSVIAILAERYA
ncbi:MAG: lysostaphin resistance A-like protein [Actinomycetota bacterium]